MGKSFGGKKPLCSRPVCLGDFPGGPAVKSPPSSAEDAGLIPGQGTKIPRAAGQLSLCTLEPVHHN